VDSKPASRCGAAFAMLSKPDAFESGVGIAGCLTDAGMAFRALLRLQDVQGFKSLTVSSSGAAELYGLCGLERLRDPAAPAVRARLLASKATTSIAAGDELPYPKGSVGELLRFRDGGSPVEFDNACETLARTHSPCDPRGSGARLTCR
jgi:hypothetical protein